MMKKLGLGAAVAGLAFGAALGMHGCVASTHAVEAAALGVPRSSAALEAVIDEPGPVLVETLRAARWSVPRSGLINLNDPRAQAAGLKDGPEPIEVYFHALRHPSRGLFIVDTGVEHGLASDAAGSRVTGLERRLSGLDEMRVELDLRTWLERAGAPLAGVFLTHLHLDHVLGMPDVPPGTPIYAGPGEARATGFLNAFTRPLTDRLFEGQGPIAELRLERDADADAVFAGVLDVFGDGSVWAVHVPGHTPGSMAYLARTPDGPVALLGDACHTRFGWEHGVEPGTFSMDRAESRRSLDALERFAARHPALDVRLGHQTRSAPPARSATLDGELHAP